MQKNRQTGIQNGELKPHLTSTHHRPTAGVLMSKHWVNAKVGERQRRKVEGHTLLIKHGVKMAGYWSSYFVALLWPDRNRDRNWGRYRPIVIEKAWSIEDLIHGVTKSGNLKRARQAQVARSDSNSQHRIQFMYPVRRTSHVRIILHHPSPLYQHRMTVTAHVEAVVIRVLVR